MFFLALLLLSLSIYFAAYRHLVGRQEESIAASAEIIADKVVEEMRDEDSLSNREMLSELNSDTNLTLIVKDAGGVIVNSSRNFKIDESRVPPCFMKAVLYSSREHPLLLCYEEEIADDLGSAGLLTLVINMRAEYEFLHLLIPMKNSNYSKGPRDFRCGTRSRSEA